MDLRLPRGEVTVGAQAMALVRRVASVLLPLLVTLAALGIGARVAHSGVPIQGGPIFGGPGNWKVDRDAEPQHGQFPFLDSQRR
jgi:hypothetical protein